MQVKLIVGATHAYVCITKENGGSLDWRLDGGCGPVADLRRQIERERADIARREARLATLAEAAAVLELSGHR
jgi:hypothetical protein